MEVGAQDIQGLPLSAQPAPRQSYVSMAGKPMSSSHEPPCQWNQAPVTLIYQWKNKGGAGFANTPNLPYFMPKFTPKFVKQKSQWLHLPIKFANPGGGGGRDGGKRMILRLNKESGCQENVVLSTWRWCKQGCPRLSQTTDHWPLTTPALLIVNCVK